MAKKDEGDSELDGLIKKLQPHRVAAPRPAVRVGPRPRIPTLVDAAPPPVVTEEEVEVAPGDPRAEIDAGWNAEEPTRDLRPAHLRATSPTGDRDSQVHVHLYQPPKTPSLRPSERVKAIVQNDWVKLIVAVILGVTGGAGGHVAAKKAEPDAAVELEKQLEEMRRDVRALKVAASATKVTLATQKKDQSQVELETYELGRYLFSVLPELGVHVYVARGKQVPDAVEFLPPPLTKDTVGPNDPKPIQPREAFPMPDKP